MYAMEGIELHPGPVVKSDYTGETIGFIYVEYGQFYHQPRPLYFSNELELRAHADYMGAKVMLGPPPELLHSSDFLQPRERELHGAQLASVREAKTQKQLNKAMLRHTEPAPEYNWGEEPWRMKPGKA
ncbi:MAG: hypothetical protein QM729_21305 [Solirubrobacterales bacterium]